MFGPERHTTDQEPRDGTVVSLRSARRAQVRSGRPGDVHASHSDSSGASSARFAKPVRAGVLTEAELSAIEATYAEGITAAQIVMVFTSRGIKFSEATFRKYVQQGLLPRSKRVGRKGKFRGSLGMYPAKTVRRINAVKDWMASGFTIEQIQGQFLLYTDIVETLAEGFDELWERLATDAAALTDEALRRALTKDLQDLQRDAAQLTRRVADATKRLAAPRGELTRRTGAAGSAEDLL